MTSNRLAHESIREQKRQGSTSRDRETAKHLLRVTTADLWLRDEKGLERLRAYCPALRRAMAARLVGRCSARSTRRFTGSCCPFAARGLDGELLMQQAGREHPA